MTITEFLLARIEGDEENAGRYVDIFPEGDMAPLFRRVLRECAAKRAIIGSHESCTSMTDKEQELGVKLVGVGMMKGLHLTVQSLAAVYADHPDYKQEWAA